MIEEWRKKKKRIKKGVRERTRRKEKRKKEKEMKKDEGEERRERERERERLDFDLINCRFVLGLEGKVDSSETNHDKKGVDVSNKNIFQSSQVTD